MSKRFREDARRFIEQRGLTSENCFLEKSGSGYCLVTFLPNGEQLDWHDDRDEREVEETWRQLIEAGVEVRG